MNTFNFSYFFVTAVGNGRLELFYHGRCCCRNSCCCCCCGCCGYCFLVCRKCCLFSFDQKEVTGSSEGRLKISYYHSRCFCRNLLLQYSAFYAFCRCCCCFQLLCDTGSTIGLLMYLVTLRHTAITTSHFSLVAPKPFLTLVIAYFLLATNFCQNLAGTHSLFRLLRL